MEGLEALVLNHLSTKIGLGLRSVIGAEYFQIMKNAPVEFTTSDINRNPSKVFKLALQKPVTLMRRNGPDMILVSKREIDARAQALEAVASIMSAASISQNSPYDNFPVLFPWMLLLESSTQIDCAEDITKAMEKFVESSMALPFVKVIEDWKERARLIAINGPSASVGNFQASAHEIQPS